MQGSTIAFYHDICYYYDKILEEGSNADSTKNSSRFRSQK
jgi:hypothetical protein